MGKCSPPPKSCVRLCLRRSFISQSLRQLLMINQSVAKTIIFQSFNQSPRQSFVNQSDAKPIINRSVSKTIINQSVAKMIIKQSVARTIIYQSYQSPRQSFVNQSVAKPIIYQLINQSLRQSFNQWLLPSRSQVDYWIQIQQAKNTTNDTRRKVDEKQVTTCNF